MQIRILGTAAGGGFPQWNCNCPCCQVARDDAEKAPGRLHASIAISASGDSWYILNATPDIRLQIESCPELQAGPGYRDSPLKGILLTDAEFDHTIGLLVIREGSALSIYGTKPVVSSLEKNFPVRNLLGDYALFQWQEINCQDRFSIDDDLIEVEAIELCSKPPRYVAQTGGSGTESFDWVIGYKFRDKTNYKTLLFAPQVAQLDGKLFEAALEADCLFIDGTFSCKDEIPNLGISERNALDMGHLPLFDEDGILSGIEKVNAVRKDKGRDSLDSYLIHINNPNPILVAGTEEYNLLKRSCLKLACDGTALSL